MTRDRLVDLPAPTDLARLRAEVMSQREMAERIGVDPGQLSRFEAGKGEMAYARIRRYVHVLNLRRAASDPHRFLVERVLARGPLPELRPHDRLDAALEAMASAGASQLPVLTARGDDYAGVLTEQVVCEAFVDAEPARALARPVGSLRLAPVDRVRPGDSLARVAALLASQSLVLVEDDAKLAVGFASRQDFLPLVLGRRGPQARSGSAREATRSRRSSRASRGLG